MAFNQKILQCDFSLGGAGTFVGGGSALSSAGLRQSVKVQSVAGITMSHVEAAIYGLPLSLMDQYSTIGTNNNEIGKNTITISAGDSDTGVSQIFMGAITTAYVDAQSQPEVAFRVMARAGLTEAAMPVPPLSFSGGTDVATIAQKMASAAGLQFTNNGVNVKLSNPYYWGSARTQILELCDHAGIQHIIDCGTFAIWPVTGSRSNTTTLISPQTGMRGYPAFDSNQIIVTTLFNPAIKYGDNVQIQSDLQPACGMWNIVGLSHDLSTITPRGPWFQTIHGTPLTGGQTTPTGSN